MTRIVKRDGTITYTNENGEFHREYGPALIYPYGDEYWYKNGKLHREDGPAAILSDGTKYWYKNGKCHREDGPAIMNLWDYEYWYRDNEDITELVKDHVTNWRNWTDKEKLIFKLKFF